jgi:riboflavin kinase/FMN adenylyltransferase
MEIVRLDPLSPAGWPDPCVAVGNFDGVHRGHQALVAAAVAAARESGGTSAVLTFDPHPSRVLSPDRAPSALMTLEQKAEILAALGIDRFAALGFDAEMARRSPEEFARVVLCEAVGARTVVVGSHFRFGRNRAGDVATLRRLGREMGFEVRGVAPVLHEGESVSSTRIREALARGAVESARLLLGRPFFVDGRVVRGAGRGRTLGIPTANLELRNETLPGRGVYAGRCRVLGQRADRPCVVNVGRRPTFGGGALLCEVHVLDFDGDLYDSLLRVEFHERLREERPFPGAEALREQIRDDIARARAVLEKA